MEQTNPTYFSILVAMLRNKNMLDKTATKKLVVIVNKHDVWEELIIFLNVMRISVSLIN